jgi:hypothetical protein
MIKFNREVLAEIFEAIDKIIKNGLPISLILKNICNALKSFKFPINVLSSENGFHIISLILNKMQKLTTIYFGPFIIQMLTNSHETLQFVQISQFCIPDISFPKLKILETNNWKGYLPARI